MAGRCGGLSGPLEMLVLPAGSGRMTKANSVYPEVSWEQSQWRDQVWQEQSRVFGQEKSLRAGREAP